MDQHTKNRFKDNDDLSKEELVIKRKKLIEKIEELEEEYRTAQSYQKNDIGNDQKFLEDELEYVEFLISSIISKRSR